MEQNRDFENQTLLSAFERVFIELHASGNIVLLNNTYRAGVRIDLLDSGVMAPSWQDAPSANTTRFTIQIR